jgi:uncharacterized protein YjbI with pentapeptide repeats
MKVSDHPNDRKRSKRSLFEWIQLIAIISIVIVVIIYIIIDSVNKQSIASADRLKHSEIANGSRITEFDIAQANRLHEILIAEESRQEDRDLALDQQRENILVQYQTFMANLLLQNGIALNATPAAKPVALSMTLTTLSQLDLRRKSILMRSLYHSKLIILHRNSQPYDTSVLQLGHIDLSNIKFGSAPDSPDERPRLLSIDWYYLSLPYATLINSSFRHTLLDCATLSSAVMDLADFSFVSQQNHQCFGGTRAGQISFHSSSLVNASFYKASFRFTSFDKTNLTFADMRHLYCMECGFVRAILFKVDLTSSLIFPTFLFDPGRLEFSLTDFRHAIMHSAHFRSINFSQSDWSNGQASNIILFNSTFINSKMENCSLTTSTIQQCLFQNINMFNVDLSDAKLLNVSFINSDLRNANMSYLECNYCEFINVTFQSAIFNNASLRYSKFFNCSIDENQLDEVIDLSGSILSNGTMVKSYE